MTAQGQGSGRFTAGIHAALRAEDAQFKAASQVLLQRISQAKGDKKQALIREYEALQREHVAKSSAIQGQYTAAGKAEAERIKTAFGGVATVTVAGGKTAAAGTKTAYGDMTNATNTGANAFGGILGGHKTTLAEKQRLLFDT